MTEKTPNITELHNQLLDIRKELARQKYVNQVLWRKLDALIDIQGSNTRAELAIELANYHDELEALKAKQHRVHDARTAILNPLSRSSSGVCVVMIVFDAWCTRLLVFVAHLLRLINLFSLTACLLALHIRSFSVSDH